MNIIGEIEGRTCVIVDDIVDTAGTLCHAADALKARGAKRVLAYATHPVFSGNAVRKINKFCSREVVVTDTIPLRQDALGLPEDQTVVLLFSSGRNNFSHCLRVLGKQLVCRIGTPLSAGRG